jgi:hypothetical protein
MNMKPAEYCIIRYIPDLARSEALNVGIAAWTETEKLLRLDNEAIRRVVRENPAMATDALRSLESSLRLRLEGAARPEQIAGALADPKGFPIVVTEPRETTILEGETLEKTLDRLLQRIVHPRRRSGYQGANPVRILARRFQPLLASKLVTRNHPFENSRSGVPRYVEFFANSGANVALDTVRLGLRDADEVVRRADAAAFKAEDILAANRIRLAVFCDLSAEAEMGAVNRDAIRIIRSSGATVVTEIDEAAGLVEEAVKAR